MNIKITHNWLLEYLDTDAAPEEIQKYLSLCGPSIERVEKVNDSAKGGLTDYVYEIEVTSNRVDMASVFGLAQEAQAILPQFGKRAKLKFNPLEKYRFSKINVETHSHASLQIKITKPDLCSRFTALVLSNIHLQDSPEFIQKRLQICGVKIINNVVDISNYLMLSLGQPTHIFDYDRIGQSTLLMRESKKGEEITTLDGKNIKLPGEDIVIEDGEGKLIDLCGIMGGLNSAVSEKTKSIVLFVQTYNKQKIRRTSMKTGQRTIAATYFEKGLDEQRVEPTLVYGVELLQKYAQVETHSNASLHKLYDIYPQPKKPKTILINYEDIEKIIGIKIDQKKVSQILQNLGFLVETHSTASLQYTVTIPSFRDNDIFKKEDLIEEIARVYGYFNLPNNLQQSAYVEQPKEIEGLFTVQQKLKYLLKHLGLQEVMNWSMVSAGLLEKLGLNPQHHLKIKNTISTEIEYLRRSLLPSLIKNMQDNEGRQNTLKLFEIAKSYQPQNNKLPLEQYKLGIAVNTSFSDLKGIIETLLQELKIEKSKFAPSSSNLFLPSLQAQIQVNGKAAGIIGSHVLKSQIYLAEIDLEILAQSFRLLTSYQSLSSYATVKLDHTFEISPQKTCGRIKEKALSSSKLIKNLEVLDLFGNKLTIRFYFSSAAKNITEEEAKKELQFIVSELE